MKKYIYLAILLFGLNGISQFYSFYQSTNENDMTSELKQAKKKDKNPAMDFAKQTKKKDNNLVIDFAKQTKKKDNSLNFAKVGSGVVIGGCVGYLLKGQGSKDGQKTDSSSSPTSPNATDAQNKIKERNTTITKLTEEKNKLIAEKSLLEAEKSLLEKDLTAQTPSNDSLIIKELELEKDITEKTQEIENLLDENDDLLRRENKLEAENSQLNSKIQNLQSNVPGNGTNGKDSRDESANPSKNQSGIEEELKVFKENTQERIKGLLDNMQATFDDKENSVEINDFYTKTITEKIANKGEEKFNNDSVESLKEAIMVNINKIMQIIKEETYKNEICNNFLDSKIIPISEGNFDIKIETQEKLKLMEDKLKLMEDKLIVSLRALDTTITNFLKIFIEDVIQDIRIEEGQLDILYIQEVMDGQSNSQCLLFPITMGSKLTKAYFDGNNNNILDNYNSVTKIDLTEMDKKVQGMNKEDQMTYKGFKKFIIVEECMENYCDTIKEFDKTFVNFIKKKKLVIHEKNKNEN